MEQKSLTALISAFSRAYHALNNEVTIFNDSLARDLLTDEEFNQIAKNMSNGIGFFNPSFVGEPEQALRWVVDNQLSPSPLGRAAFAEKSLEWAVRTGTEQYLIWGAGYDTFAYRQPLWAKALQIFEVDHPATARDKQERLKSAGIVIPDNICYAHLSMFLLNMTDPLLLVVRQQFDQMNQPNLALFLGYTVGQYTFRATNLLLLHCLLQNETFG